MTYTCFQKLRITRISALLILFFLPVTHALATPDVEAGKQLFDTQCVACHGSKGTGGVGVPLSLPDFINGVDDKYLKTTIKIGRPGRIMPPFSHLNSREIKQIVAYMRSWTGVIPKPYSKKRIKGDRQLGQLLYQKNCSSCHGANGEGGHGTGVTFSRPRDFPILAPALNNSGFLAAASDTMIKSTLLKGRKGTPMISFITAGMSEQNIDDVVSFVRSFEKIAAKKLVEKIEPATLVVESPYSVEKTVANLKQAVVSANMKLIRTQYFDEGFVDKGTENKKRVIVYSCGFNFLNEAMKIDPRVGIFLPCRVTVAQHNDKVLIMTVNPKRLAYLFNNSELSELCGKMKDRYLGLMEEATF